MGTPDERLEERFSIGGQPLELARLPKGLVVREPLGLVASEHVDGQVVYTSTDYVFEPRAVKTPGGDYLLMFPANTKEQPQGGAHYAHGKGKVNDMLAFRSRDQGRTWAGPKIAFDIDYSQHGFVPLIPRGTSRIYAFGTQPIPGLWTTERGQAENAPIGYRYSDDDGHTWSEVRLIRPVNDPDFKGMSVMRMCETDAGTWLIGSHEGDWSYKPLITCEYILRSEDRGRTWTVVPGPRHGGWRCPGFGRMDEGRPINLGGGKVLLVTRTPEGHLWELCSDDDGKTWSDPRPTPLIHPDAPPMLFHLADGKTLAAFHHNRHSDRQYTGLSDKKVEMMKDRNELWVALSEDEGRTWSEPRFVLANALAPSFPSAWRNFQVSYADVIADGGVLHLFLPHRWHRVLHLRLREEALRRLPTAGDLRGA